MSETYSSKDFKDGKIPGLSKPTKKGKTQSQKTAAEEKKKTDLEIQSKADGPEVLDYFSLKMKPGVYCEWEGNKATLTLNGRSVTLTITL